MHSSRFGCSCFGKLSIPRLESKELKKEQVYSEQKSVNVGVKIRPVDASLGEPGEIFVCDDAAYNPQKMRSYHVPQGGR